MDKPHRSDAALLLFLAELNKANVTAFVGSVGQHWLLSSDSMAWTSVPGFDL